MWAKSWCSSSFFLAFPLCWWKHFSNKKGFAPCSMLFLHGFNEKKPRLLSVVTKLNCPAIQNPKRYISICSVDEQIDISGAEDKSLERVTVAIKWASQLQTDGKSWINKRLLTSFCQEVWAITVGSLTIRQHSASCPKQGCANNKRKI